VYTQVRQWVDIHLITADMQRALYPINVLRNLAIEHARTDFIVLLEADCLVPAGSRELLVRKYLPRMMEEAAHGTATGWIMPLFDAPDSSSVRSAAFPQDKAGLLAASPSWTPCGYDSHRYFHSLGWEEATEPQSLDLPSHQEPYYVVNRRYAARYDPRRGWLSREFGHGPSGDKLFQVEGQKRLTPFKVLPDAFILRFKSWPTSPSRKPYVAQWEDDHDDTLASWLCSGTRTYDAYFDPEAVCNRRRLNPADSLWWRVQCYLL
jgi:hypothetical protein